MQTSVSNYITHLYIAILKIQCFSTYFQTVLLSMMSMPCSCLAKRSARQRILTHICRLTSFAVQQTQIFTTQLELREEIWSNSFTIVNLFRKTVTIIISAFLIAECFKRLQNLRILNPDLRIMASMGCGDEIIRLCENDAKRAMLEDSLVQYLHERGLDGIDLNCDIKYTENRVVIF